MRLRRLTLSWLLLAAMAACGGSGKGTEPGDGDPPDGDSPNGTVEADGRVFLDNQTAYQVEAAYLNTVEVDEPRIMRTVVGAGTSGDIGQVMLPGGSEVEFDLVLLLPPEEGFRVRRKAQIQVDGDVVLQIRLGTEGDPFSMVIE